MKEEKNILNYLFICILLNLIPTALLGIFDISGSLYTILNGMVYITQTIMMLLVIKNKVKSISNKALCVLLTFTGMQLLTQLINVLKWNTINNGDIINIISVTINIFIFIICCSKFSITNEQLIAFMKKMVKLGLIACIYNIVINWEAILSISTATSSYAVNLSSFFPNRNQFGIFLIIVVVSNLYIMVENNSKKNKLYQILFIINIILTLSRNSILGLMCIYIFKFYLDNKKKKESKKNLIIIIGIILILFISMICILNNKEIFSFLDNILFRTENIQSGSGRFKVWENGIKIVINNNPITGVGRFMASELNKNIYQSSLNHFHSIYIETLVTYGIVGLLGLLTLIGHIIKKVKITNIKKEYKNIIIASIMVFMIISIFETTTRFSIGYVDTISLIYFFTIPLIFKNIESKN